MPQGKNLCDYIFLFRRVEKVMEGQSLVAKNLVGLVWWEIKMTSKHVRLFSKMPFSSV